MKSRKDYIIVVKREELITYLDYKVSKGKGIVMTWTNRYEKIKDNATVFNSYGKALSMLIKLDNIKDNDEDFAGESYDIIEKGATL